MYKATWEYNGGIDENQMIDTWIVSGHAINAIYSKNITK